MSEIEQSIEDMENINLSIFGIPTSIVKDGEKKTWETLNDRERYQRITEMRDKFKKDFFQKYYNYDPIFHAVFEFLIRNEDPCSIIELLIEMLKKESDLVRMLKMAALNQPQTSSH